MSEAYENAVARENIKGVLDFCKRHNIDFDAILKSVHDESQIIRIGRKYRTGDGRAVTILTVNAPNPHFPVIGHDDEGEAMTWTPTGAFLHGEASLTDLVPAEG